MRPDSDLAAPGAHHPLEIGDGTHGISAKRTSSGEVVLTSCSNCAILRDRLRVLEQSLPEGPAKQRAGELAREAASLQQRINEGRVTDIAGETRSFANRVNGAIGAHPDLAWAMLNYLEGVTVLPHPPAAPEPGGRIDAASREQFDVRTGGTARGGWFEPENAIYPAGRANPEGVLEQAQKWYNIARTIDAVPALGKFREVWDAVAARAQQRAARGSAGEAEMPPELYRLNVPQELWQLQVNDAWILGHAERGSTFQVVSNPTARSNLETRLEVGGNPRNRTGDRVQSVFWTRIAST
jgi:hypothetical protein